MKGLILLISSLLLIFLAPIDKMDGEDSVTLSTVCGVTGGNAMSEMTDDIYSNDALYDSNTMALLATYDAGNDDVVPCRTNRLGQQLRVFASRMLFRCHYIVLQVKKMTHLLSDYMTTLTNHISQVYSSLLSCFWQYAADCYVFALRQIII